MDAAGPVCPSRRLLAGRGKHVIPPPCVDRRWGVRREVSLRCRRPGYLPAHTTGLPVPTTHPATTGPSDPPLRSVPARHDAQESRVWLRIGGHLPEVAICAARDFPRPPGRHDSTGAFCGGSPTSRACPRHTALLYSAGGTRRTGRPFAVRLARRIRSGGPGGLGESWLPGRTVALPTTPSWTKRRPG